MFNLTNYFNVNAFLCGSACVASILADKPAETTLVAAGSALMATGGALMTNLSASSKDKNPMKDQGSDAATGPAPAAACKAAPRV